jgi:hypothetical protein
VLALATQAGWGLYPVLCRYFQASRDWQRPCNAALMHRPRFTSALQRPLTNPFALPPVLQNQAQHTVTALQFSFLVNALAAPGLLLFYSLPRHLALAQGAKQRVSEQRGMRLIDSDRLEAQYQLGRLRRTASFQAMLPTPSHGWAPWRGARPQPAATAAIAAAAATGLRPRGAILRRPFLIEDTTTGGPDASLLPQAVQANFSISKPPTTRHRAAAAAADRRTSRSGLPSPRWRLFSTGEPTLPSRR